MLKYGEPSGAAVTKKRFYPDFNVVQYWGADTDENDRADVIRIVIEVGTRESHSALISRTFKYLKQVGSRWRGRLLGLALIGEFACLIEWKSSNLWYFLYEEQFVSIFDSRFIEEMDKMRQFCYDDDDA